jgi:hypothetical protein
MFPTPQYLKVVIHNTWIREEVCTIFLPFKSANAVKGKYSKLWKAWRISLANHFKMDKNFIRAKVARYNARGSEIIISLPTGVKLSFPDDVTGYDIKIILAQLKVLEMPFNKVA